MFSRIFEKFCEHPRSDAGTITQFGAILTLRPGQAVPTGRIEIDGELSQLAIPPFLWNELCAHAVETLPEECCGLIGGDEEVQFHSVYRCRNDMTQRHRSDPESFPRDGATAFFMNESDYLTAIDLAEAKGERITAIYHSHVGAGAYFSELDQVFATQQLFPFPEAHHFVVSVLEDSVREIASFHWQDERFVGRRLTSHRF